MTEQNNEIPIAPAPDDPVYQLFNDIQSEIARLKKRPPRDFGHFMIDFTGTILPLMRDIAYRLFETSAAVEELFERTEDQESGSTQFTFEDAKKFDLVLQFAKGMAEAALLNATGEAEKLQLQQIISTAEECLQIMEEATLEEEEEDEQEEDKETPPAEQN